MLTSVTLDNYGLQQTETLKFSFSILQNKIVFLIQKCWPIENFVPSPYSVDLVVGQT